MTRAIVVDPVHAWSTADVAHGWTAGLRECGVQTGTFNTGAQTAWFGHAEVEGEYLDRERVRAAVGLNLLGTVYECDPDVVVIVHGANVDYAAIAAIRCPVVLVLTECPYEQEGQALAAVEMAPDMILVNDPLGADVFAGIAPTHYVSHAYDPKVHYPTDAAPSLDACFVGTGFASRVEFLERVDWTGIHLGLGGLWNHIDDSPLYRYLLHPDDAAECVDNVVTADIYRSSATAFNIYRTDSYGASTADGWAIGPREVELAACGTWMARQPRGEGDGLFPMLPTFTDPGELGDLIRWALAHPDKRRSAAESARAVITDRTFANHAAATLRRLGI